MTASNVNLPRWCAAHIFLSKAMDEFLYLSLGPLLIEWKRTAVVKRFFFIRYSEGGPHIRLRMMPGRAVPPSLLLLRLADTFEAFRRGEAPEFGGRIVETRYDRSADYFGENAESVYSELLNEQTSLLALALCSRSFKSRAQVVASGAGALSYLIQASSVDRESARRITAQSSRFASQVLADLGWSRQETGASTSEKFKAILRRVSTDMSPELRATAAARTARLLKRARQQTRGGRFVAVHSMHLFCNKIGILPPEEFQIFEALREIA